MWRVLLVLLPLCSSPAALPARGQEVPALPPSSELRLAGRTVAIFRGPRSGYTAEQRVTAAEAQLEQALELGEDLPVSQRVTAEGNLVFVGEHEVFAVLPVDVDEPAGETLETLSKSTVARLAQALAEVREARGARGWLVALGKSALTLALGALLAWVILRISRRLSDALEQLAKKTSGSLRSNELRTIGQQNVVPLVRGLKILLTWVLIALLCYLIVQRLLLNFPYSRPAGEHLKAELVDQIRGLALAFVAALPGLAMVVFVWLCARFAVGVVQRFFQAAARGQVHSHLAEAVTPPVAERLVAAVVWLAALVVAYPYIPGSDSGAFRGVSVFTGLMVSLGSSSLIGQMASGLVLAYSRAFRVGDVVRFGEHEGKVISFGLLATKIQTWRHEEVNVPNSVFTNATTINYTRLSEKEGVYLSTRLTLGYDIPWRTVHELLLGAARRTDGVRGDPAPFVLQMALSDFYIEYDLRAAAADQEQRPAVLSRLLANVLDDFEKAGVQILSPHHFQVGGRIDAPGRPPMSSSGMRP